MSGDRHSVTYIRARDHSRLKAEWAQCKCGWSSGWHMTREATTLLAGVHIENVDRVRLALSRRTNPGLADQYAYYVERSEDSHLTMRDREQWALLAKELEPRVVGVEFEDDPLF